MERWPTTWAIGQVSSRVVIARQLRQLPRDVGATLHSFIASYFFSTAQSHSGERNRYFAATWSELRYGQIGQPENYDGE